ncbi:MAG: group 1 glycosyl transferase [Candidatus Saccharibacteria bacterium]|nr:group 1 glycosyl transferase [Candidatus Saccharibacteria bacterium]
MNIGIDIRPLQAETKHRGIGKALSRTLRPLLKFGSASGDKFTFFYDPLLAMPEIATDAYIKYLPVRTPNINKKKYIRILLRPMKKINIKSGVVDVLLQFDFGLGILKNIPTVTMFHDMIPVLFRQADVDRQNAKKTIRRIKGKLGDGLNWQRYLSDLRKYNNAASILAISENSRNDLLSYDKKIDPSKIKVALLGIDSVLDAKKRNIENEIVKKIINTKYLLYVGGIDTRKNVIQLVREFHELKPNYPSLKLVVVGKEFELFNNLENLGWHKEIDKIPEYKKDIILPGYVSDFDLQLLYCHAQAFIFPSLYEGFGMPLLEAMALGCPCIAYSNSSITEIAGDAIVLVESGKSMAQEIKTILDSESIRRDLIRKGVLQYKKFPWENTARIILDEIHSISKK